MATNKMYITTATGVNEYSYIVKNLEGEFISYLRSDAKSLLDVYKTASNVKWSNFQRLKCICASLHGVEFRVVTYNTNFFTVGYMIMREGIPYFCYHTKWYDYIWKIDPEYWPRVAADFACDIVNN